MCSKKNVHSSLYGIVRKHKTTTAVVSKGKIFINKKKSTKNKLQIHQRLYRGGKKMIESTKRKSGNNYMSI